ncbi:MAG: hypothetical protein CMB31_07005 [Euryarchaeota archaeon]|nr:hypothetical protein [Euryarchaeota archaeon]
MVCEIFTHFHATMKRECITSKCMQARSWSLFLVFLLLVPLLPLTSSSENEMHADENYWSSGQASEFWKIGASPNLEISSLKQTSGLLHPVTGSFDPMLVTPVLSGNLHNNLDVVNTGMLIIQDIDADRTDLEEWLKVHDFPILDVIPDDALLIRVPTHPNELDAAISLIASNEGIRWFGSQHPGWRLSPELPSSGKIDVNIIPSPDLEDDEFDVLESTIYLMGAEVVHCDAWLCQVEGIQSHMLVDLVSSGQVLFIEPSPKLVLENIYARTVSNIDDVLSNHNPSLTGQGQVVAVSDSGLDQDHGDFNGRIRAVYNQYGPDNSAADMHSGHGTHVTATLLGDGSGDNSARGMAPNATFHFYQLEYDQTGALARYGSLFDMFRHSWQQNARLQTNSWGSENLGGQYNSDSRSADSFADQYGDFLVLFAAGNEGASGSGTISPPSTAKNVLTIGASTSGRPGTASAGQVPTFSSIGPTSDGRIKPDLVSPGVQICSARAQEAQFPMGSSCSSARHSDGTTPLYQQMDGTSMATPVAAGNALLARQFLTDEFGISSPRSDLLKALLVNGAKDIGARDIPNMDEGWGQIDLEQTLYPKNGLVPLNTFMDWNQTLQPGYSYVYTYDWDASHGVDITIAWTDAAGSSSASQSTKRLVNDLDLTVIAPDGSVYKGNVFSNGYSTTGGSSDDLNNVERVKLPPTSLSGTWEIRVQHTSGSAQDFAMVATSIGTENLIADLAVFSGSLWVSADFPLEGDAVVVRASWLNQAPGAASGYDILIEDISTNPPTLILQSSRGPIEGGSVDSITTQHTFTTTGVHTLRLTLDSEDDVPELNDEVNGTDNNQITYDVNVTAIGVRIVPYMENGNLPSSPEELSQARHRTINPSITSSVSFDLDIMNEGTASIEAGLIVTPVQFVRDDGILDAPEDEWSRTLSESGPWTLPEGGALGSTRTISLSLVDEDADFNDPYGAIFALPGTYIVDLTMYDRNSPLVSYTLRLSIEVERVEGLNTVLAGDQGLAGKPGDTIGYTITVRNSGNGPTIFSVNCDNDQRWPIELGNGNTSSIELDPLNRLQFIGLSVRIVIPEAYMGEPAAGSSTIVTCNISSTIDSSITSTEISTVSVLESREYSVDIFEEDGTPVGPSGLAIQRAVLNDDLVNTSIHIENLGNTAFDVDVSMSTGLVSWPVWLYVDGTQVSSPYSINLQPGVVSYLQVQMAVSSNADNFDVNVVTIRTSLSGSIPTVNQTKFIVEQRTDFVLEGPESGIIDVAPGSTSTFDVIIRNTGNVPIVLNWTFPSLPEGWSIVFFSVKPNSLMMGEERTVNLRLSVPLGIESGVSETEVGILVRGGLSSSSLDLSQLVLLGVQVSSLAVPVVTFDDNRFSNLPRGEPSNLIMNLTNGGNLPLSVSLNLLGPEGWTYSLDQESISDLSPGDSVDILLSVTPSEDTPAGVQTFVVISVIDGEEIESGSFEVTAAATTSGGGAIGLLESAGVPNWAAGIVVLLVVVSLFGSVFILRNRGISSLSEGERLIPAGSSLNQ